MTNHKVMFVKENITIMVPEGTPLLEAQHMAGLSPDAPCGGEGKCGKCLTDIRKCGEEAWETVLACQWKVTADVNVRTRTRAKAHKILTTALEHEVEFHPELQVCEITVPACRIGESVSDWDRFCGALSEYLGEEREFETDLSLVSRIGPLVKKEQGRVQAVVCGKYVLDIAGAGDMPVLMAAFDIGTTSVAGYLLDARTGGELGVVSALNTQTTYGADVIMRANYALEHGVEELSGTIRSLLNVMLRELADKAGVHTDNIYQVSVVGNTCMHHLFLNISPDSLVHAPYNPVISRTLVLPAKDYDLDANPNARLLVLPVIAGFVGADTVGCLISGNFEREEKITLMIDIGTNGEIVLGNKNRRIACSTAAGPAFEGAKIACGMRGAKGAIEHVKAEDGKLKFSVIGGGKPVGICGSGLIDLLAALLDIGALDDTGRLEETADTIQVDGKPAYLLASEEESGSGSPVYLSQKDIREVQLAKGAIAAGIQLLAQQLGISLKNVEQVYIAGAFGNYMDPGSACRIGLIPGELRGRIIPVGNAAGEGAKLVLLNQEECRRAGRLARTTEFLELASLPEFQDTFVDELAFPE